MSDIVSSADLRARILHLEQKQADEGKVLKEQFILAYESIKPVNIIKSTFHEVLNSPDIHADVLNVTVGLAASYLTEKMVGEQSAGTLRKLVGAAILLGITTLTAQKPELIKNLGRKLVELFKNLWGEPEKPETT